MLKNFKRRFKRPGEEGEVDDEAYDAAVAAASQARANRFDGCIYGYTRSDFVKPMKLIKEAATRTERDQLLLKKIRLCHVLFDFNAPPTSQPNPELEFRGREAKKHVLIELVDFVTSNKAPLTEDQLNELLRMIARNLFRSAPLRRYPGVVASETHSQVESYQIAMLPPRDTNSDEEEPVLDNAWPHLQIVYELFLRIVVSPEVDTKVLRKYLDVNFVAQLLELFKSEDPRERDYLKTVLHRVYGKLMQLRPAIRRLINHNFYRLIYESGDAAINGTAELLDIYGSIINGFALPLKQEHRNFLTHVLMPIHKVAGLNSFHNQLVYGVVQFIDKEPELSEPVLRSLLRYWPHTNSPKQLMFLGELEDILDCTPPEVFSSVGELICRRIAACLQSPHFQVVERTIALLQSDVIVTGLMEERQRFMPIIFPPLQQCAQGHWNSMVTDQAQQLVRSYTDIDPPLFDSLNSALPQRSEQEQQTVARRQRAWQSLEQMASKAAQS